MTAGLPLGGDRRAGGGRRRGTRGRRALGERLRGRAEADHREQREGERTHQRRPWM